MVCSRSHVQYIIVYQIIISDISLKQDAWLHFCRREFRCILNHFYAVPPPEAFCEPVFVSQVDVFSTRL